MSTVARINLHAIRNLAPLGSFYLPARFLVEHGEADRPFEIADDATGKAENDAVVSDRLRGATFLPILQELDEDVAAPADIDLGAEQALRFTPPCRLMDQLGRAEVERLVKPLCDAHGLKLPGSLAKAVAKRPAGLPSCPLFAYSSCAATYVRAVPIAASSFRPMRRASTSSLPAAVSNIHPVAPFTTGTGNGHPSPPTTSTFWSGA